jgi:hypothetical protein
MKLEPIDDMLDFHFVFERGKFRETRLGRIRSDLCEGEVRKLKWKMRNQK